MRRATTRPRTEVTFESASLEDLPEIMSLEEQGFAAGIGEDERVFSQRIAAFRDGFLVMRSVPDRTIIGYVCSEIWHYSEDLSAARFELNHDIRARHRIAGDELYISSMTVRSSFRGSGLGARLFAECLVRAKRRFPAIKSCILIVNETWTSARRIYAASGFVEVARIPDFFAPSGHAPQGAIIMRKNMDLPSA